MESAPRRWYLLPVAETVPCPGCGAEVPPTGVCRFCGSTAFVDGVAGKLLPSDLKCPRCPGSPPLRGVEHEGFRADLCLKCHGVWFGLGLLEEVIRTAVKRKVRKGEGDEGPVHGGVEPVRYANCPKCGGGMARAAFAQKPLVIIDRCPSHGDWCDGGELSQLKAVARSRGLAQALGRTAAPEPPKGPDAGKVRLGTAAEAQTEALMSVLRNRPDNWGIVPPEVSAQDALEDRRRSGRYRRRGRDLFDLLWDILSR